MKTKKIMAAGKPVIMYSRDGKSWSMRPPEPSKKEPQVNGQYGLWNDLTQAWDFGPARIEQVAAELYAQRYPDSCLPMRYVGDYNPRPLSVVERRELHRLLAEAE